MLSILATTDGSQQSLAVIPAIQKLTKDVPTRVLLITVAESPAGTPRRSTIGRAPTSSAGGVPGAPSTAFGTSHRPAERQWAESEDQAIQRVIAEGKEALAGPANTLKDAGMQVDVEVIVSDDVSKAIVDYAREKGVDLIAMATHGRSGLSSLVQGSVASAVVRSGVAPVLLVRPD